MLRIIQVIAISLVCLKFQVLAIKLPSNFKICDKNQSNEIFNECLRNALQVYVSIPQDTLTKDSQFDPFLTKSLAINLNIKKNTFAGANFKIRNMMTHGFSKLKFLKVKSNITEKSFDLKIKMLTPKILSTAQYKGNANIGGQTIDSRGQFNVTMIEVDYITALKGTIQNGLVNLNTVDVLHINPKDLKLAVTGLFPDPALNQFANDFLNHNWKNLKNEFLGRIRGNFEPVTREFFSRIPWNMLYNV